MITVTLNGKRREVERELPIEALLQLLGIDRRTVAVARNGDVVPRDRYEEVEVREGDTVEVVRMVGGG
jgi:thiamine biosynthesis protein ThiS